jgi:hypothetical protein
VADGGSGNLVAARNLLTRAAIWLDEGETVNACRARERTDLGVALRQLTATFSDRLAAIVMLAVIANLDEDPIMARTFRNETVFPWRTSAAAALERGVARGDLPPDADVPFLLDVIVGTVFQRAVINARSGMDGLDEAIVDLVLGR